METYSQNSSLVPVVDEEDAIRQTVRGTHDALLACGQDART
jgi:hypothetical protein